MAVHRASSVVHESCAGTHLTELDDAGPKYGDWRRAEKYAWNMIENLSNWFVGWTEWNWALDIDVSPSTSYNTMTARICWLRRAGRIE